MRQDLLPFDKVEPVLSGEFQDPCRHDRTGACVERRDVTPSFKVDNRTDPCPVRTLEVLRPALCEGA